MNEANFSAFPFLTQTRRVAGREWLLTGVEDQDALLAKVQTEADLANFPYGLLLWPAAVALCEYITDYPDLIKNKRVLEIGAGIGLVGLAAQRLGPAHLTQTDYHEGVLGLAQHNARQNKVTGIFLVKGDWRNWPADLTGFDLVLGSDVLYERTLHEDMARLFPRLLAPNGRIILSDPLRPQAASFMERMEKTGEWKLQVDTRRVLWESDEAATEKEIALWMLTPGGNGTKQGTR